MAHRSPPGNCWVPWWSTKSTIAVNFMRTWDCWVLKCPHCTDSHQSSCERLLTRMSDGELSLSPATNHLFLCQHECPFRFADGGESLPYLSLRLNADCRTTVSHLCS